MYKVDLPPDTVRQLAIKSHKQREEERKARIFDARQRTMGLDYDILNQQISEKQHDKLEEFQRDNAFARDMIHNDKLAQLFDQRQQQNIVDINQHLLEYRKEHQRYEDRREFDINDCEYKFKSHPARITDDDPRLSTSGMQKFAGEDLESSRRKISQQEQSREWLSQQIEEKSNKNAENKRSELMYHLRADELDKTAISLSRQDDDCRQKLEADRKIYNLQQAEENKSKNQQEQTQEQDDNFTEIANWCKSDILTENPAVAESSFGSHRVATDRWKGFSPQQIQSVLNGRAIQVEEKINLDNQKRLKELDNEHNRVNQARMGMIMESREERRRKELNRDIAEENRHLAMEQKARRNYEDNELYTNPPSREYFSQFNTTSR